jgi:hypothetical protein
MVTARTETEIFAPAKIGAIALAATGAVFALVSGNPRMAAGIASGGIVAVLNFGWLQNVMTRAFALPSSQAARFAGSRYLIRLGALGLVLYVLIVHANVSVIGLIIGLSALVASLVAVTGHFLFANGGR